VPARSQPIDIPLSAGMRENVDPKLMPDGVLVRSVNTRIRNDGRIGVRNGYESIPALTVGGAALVVYQLKSFRGRLIALGDETAVGYPTNIYELTADGTAWQPSLSGSSGFVLLNPVQRLRELPSMAQAAGGILEASTATAEGLVCTTYRTTGHATTTYLVVQRVDNGQTVLFTTLGAGETDAKVCSIENGASPRRFIVVAKLANNQDLTAYSVLGSTLSSLGVIDNGAADITAWALSEVRGQEQFVTAVDRGAGDMVVQRYTEAGVATGSALTVASTTPEHLDVWAESGPSENISVTHLDGATLTLRSWTFAGSLTGPTTISSAAVRAGWVTRAETGLAVTYSVEDVSAGIPFSTVIDVRSLAHAQLSTFTVHDFVLHGRPADASTAAQPYALLLPGCVGDACDCDGGGLELGTQRSNVLLVASPTIRHLTLLDQLLGFDGVQSLSQNGTTVAWQRLTVDGSGLPALHVSTCLLNSAEKRPWVEQGGCLFIGGGQLQHWDGSFLSECGFAEIPDIRTVAGSTAAGELTLLGEYDYVATWSYLDGRQEILLSAPSQPKTLILETTENTATLQVTTPHIMKQGIGALLMGSGIILSLWRTEWDGTAKRVGYKRAATKFLTGSIADAGDTVSVVDLLSDATLLEQEVLYTDGGSGSLSVSLPRVAGPPSEYLWPTADGLILAGLPLNSQFVQSLPIQQEKALAFAPNALTGAGFYGVTMNDVRGVASVDGVRMFFGEKTILLSGGQGPDAEGRGDIPAPANTSTDYGLVLDGWRSMLLAKEGLWFQADDEKLCVMPRGGGTPAWGGMAIRKTLREHPIIVGASFGGDDSVCAFAANGAEPVVLIRDQRTGEWSYDEVDLDSLRDVAELDGKLYLVDGDGVVYAQTSAYADNDTDPVDMLLELGDAKPFGVTGDGEFCGVTVLGEIRGTFTLSPFVSYDSGATYAPMVPQTFSGAAGTMFEAFFAPRRRKCSRYRMMFVLSNATPSELGVINSLTVHALSKQNPAKLPRARRS
jgi:hypothetical protein